MSLRLKAARSLVWTSLESAGLSVLSFVTLAVVARLITPSELGIVTVALGIVQMLTLPVEVLFHDALVQRSDTGEEHYNTAFTVSIAIAVALCLGCWLLSGQVSVLLRSPSAGHILAVLSVSLIASALGSSLVARQRREFAFKSLALRSLAGRSVGAIVGIVAACAGAGLWSLVAQQIAMTSCASLCLWGLASHRPRPVFKAARFREMFSYSMATLTNNVLFVMEPRLFTLMVAAALGPASAGYLNLAFRIVDMPRDVIAGAASQLALPLFRNVAEDRGALARAYTEAVTFTCALGFPLFLGLAACAAEIVVLLFGQKWLPSAPYVSFFAILTIVYFPKLYSLNLLSALGRPKLFVPVLIVAIATTVVGMLAIGGRALWIAAAIWALRLATSLPVEIVTTRKASGMTMRDQFRGAGYPLLAALVMSIVAWAVGRTLAGTVPTAPLLGVKIAVGIVVYAIVLFALERTIITRLLAFGRMTMARDRAPVAMPAARSVPADGMP